VREGPTILVDDLRYDRASTMDQRFFIGRRKLHFVPVTASSSPMLRFFVQTDDPADEIGVTEVRRGILRRNALPGETLVLYRNAGYTLASPHCVLYRNRATLWWTSLLTAAELALLSLLPTVVALLICRMSREPARPK
jgi:hypothetical protein